MHRPFDLMRPLGTRAARVLVEDLPEPASIYHGPSAGGSPIPGGGTPVGRTDLDVYCQCVKCMDYMTVTFWIKPIGEEGVRSAQLEPTVDAHIVGDKLRHQRNGCNGILRGISVPYTLILDGPAYP